MAKRRKKKRAGGQGGGLSRSDMRLTRQALRQDWPTSARVKTIVLETLVDFLVKRRGRGEPKADRNVIMAARTLAAFSQLTLQQAELDLKREKLEGKASDISLADLVGEAEARAEARRLELEGQ